MSLSLLVTINVLADLGLLALLAYVMSRAARLKPHAALLQVAAEQSPSSAPRQRTPRPQPTHTRAAMAKRAGSPVASAAEAR
jgi:hypothetical protein